jgi:hypothetical protein
MILVIGGARPLLRGAAAVRFTDVRLELPTTTAR